MESEEVPQPKTNEEMVKDLTLYEEIFEQVLAQVGGTVINIPEIPLPPPKKEVKLEAEKKVVEEEPRESVDSFPDFL